MPNEDFIPRRIVQTRPKGITECYHIFLQSEIYAVDGLGIHRVEDLLALCYSKPRQPSNWSYHIESVCLEECFAIDAHATEVSDAGPVSKFRLFLHPEYVQEVAERARKVILECPHRYSPKLLMECYPRVVAQLNASRPEVQ